MKFIKILPFVAAGVLLSALISDDEKTVASAKFETATAISSTRFAAAKTPASKTAMGKSIAWRASFKAAQAEAKRSGKPIFVDFYATWCGPCKMLDETTYKDAAVIRESTKFVSVKVDTDREAALAARYRIGSLPTMAVLRPDGRIVSGIIGYHSAPQTVAFLKNAATKARRK